MNDDVDAFYDEVCDRGGLTRRQLLVWAGDRLAHGAPVFVEAARLHLHGPLDVARLALAFDATVAAADALRLRVDEVEGWPVVRDGLSPAPVAEVVDLADSAAPMEALAGLAHDRTWSCRLGGPLVAVTVARMAPLHHVALVVQHQFVSDAWSFGLLHHRLVETYALLAGRGSTRAWPQFADYVVRERAYRHSRRADEARRWHASRRLGGRPAADGTTASVPTADTRVHRLTIPLGVPRSEAIRRVAAESGSGDVGVFVVVAAAVAAHLRRTTGSDDVLLDVPFANRPSARLKDTLGSFMNVCPVRIGVAGRDRVGDLRARLAHATWEAARHQAYAGRGGGVPQPYEVLVNVHRSAVGAGTFDACTMHVEWVEPRHRFGAAAIAVHDFGATGAMTLVLDLNEGTFPPAARAAFAAALLERMDEQLADPTRRLGEPSRAAPAGIAGAGRTAPTVWSRFAMQAAATPDAIALRCDGTETTYRDVWQGALGVASRLAAAGAGRDTVVAVWGVRGPAWVRALLGVWGAGAVYLPIDPAWPPARIAELLRRSGARFLATDVPPPDVVWRLPSAGATWSLLALDRDAAAGTAPPPPGPEAGDVAYVLYTSGSTGEPKGALVEHAGLLNHLDAKIALLGLGPGDRVAQNATAGFDVSLWQCLAALLVGGAVEIVADEVARDPERLLAAATAARVTVLELVPAVLRLLLDAEIEAVAERQPLAALRFLVATGEALPPELCRRWFMRHPSTPLVNAYGPTECADDVTHQVLHAAPPPGAVRVPIGTPIPGMELYVLDGALQPVADGEAGEIAVGGVGVARGYLDDPVRTAAAFVVAAVGPRGEGRRIYRTGDRGRRLPDGSFEWLGRLDGQVKIRGVRVEPAEIEAVLATCPDVRQAVVVPRPDAEGAVRLVAYVVAAPEGEEARDAADAARVREWQRVWDDTYARESDAHAADLNTAGWHSRYTRRPIPPDEMRTWVDATVASLAALAPRRVLEIGCGSGMVLHRLAPRCDRWLATDLSAVAVDYVRRHHLIRPDYAHVAAIQCAAHALPDLDELRPDLVVLNSVVQYFPSLDYLRGVLLRVGAALDQRGAVFVGDVRSLALAETFHAAVELARAPAHSTVGELRARIVRALAREQELLIDPAFFRACAGVEEGSTVDVCLKRGRVHNELTRFRYDVVWRRGGCEADAEGLELAWDVQRPALGALRALLRDRSGATTTVRGIPNPRLQRERHAVEVLASAPADTTVEALRAAVADATLVPTVDPDELWTLESDGRHEVVVTWSEAGLDRYDATFRPRDGGSRRGTRMIATKIRPASMATSGARPHANDPRLAVAAAARVDAIRSFLRARLPEAMVPAIVTVVPALPLTANGKVDYALLPAPASDRPAGAVAAGSPLEREIAAAWSRLLGVSDIGRDEDFFALGGDSMLVYRLLRELRASLDVELDVEVFLARPTVAGTAAALGASREGGSNA